MGDISRVLQLHMIGTLDIWSKRVVGTERRRLLPPSTVCTPHPACTARPLRREEAETEAVIQHSATQAASLNCFCFVASLLTFIIYYPAGLDNIMKWHAWWNVICYPCSERAAALQSEHNRRVSTAGTLGWVLQGPWCVSPLKETAPRSHLQELLWGLAKFRLLGRYSIGPEKFLGRAWGLQVMSQLKSKLATLPRGPTQQWRHNRWEGPVGGTVPGEFLPPVLTRKSRNLNTYVRTVKVSFLIVQLQVKQISVMMTCPKGCITAGDFL